MQGEEEDHGRLLRQGGGHKGERRTGVYRPDGGQAQLRRREGRRDQQLHTVSDDTTAKVVGEAWPEIELKLKGPRPPVLEHEEGQAESERGQNRSPCSRSPEGKKKDQCQEEEGKKSP